MPRRLGPVCLSASAARRLGWKIIRVVKGVLHECQGRSTHVAGQGQHHRLRGGGVTHHLVHDQDESGPGGSDRPKGSDPGPALLRAVDQLGVEPADASRCHRHHHRRRHRRDSDGDRRRQRRHHRHRDHEPGQRLLSRHRRHHGRRHWSHGRGYGDTHRRCHGDHRRRTGKRLHEAAVTITGGGATTDATATAFGGVDAVTLGNPGSGYTFPTVDFDLPDDPNGTIARAHGRVQHHDRYDHRDHCRRSRGRATRPPPTSRSMTARSWTRLATAAPTPLLRPR